MEPIKTLDVWDIDNKKEYRWRQGEVEVPELSQRNVEVLLNKVNELTERINVIGVQLRLHE